MLIKLKLIVLLKIVLKLLPVIARTLTVIEVKTLMPLAILKLMLNSQ